MDLVFVYHLRDERQMAWHGRLHGHGPGCYEFHYFISGAGRFRNGDTLNTIAPGTLHLSPPGREHQILATDPRRPITYYAILFEAEGDQEVKRLLEQLQDSAKAPHEIGTSHRFFFADLLERHLSGKRELVRSAQHQFLAFLYSLAAGTPSIGMADNAHVEKALAILQNAIDKPLDLSKLCQRLELTREHFVRLFTERMGMPPMRYYTRLKIEAAQAMLSSSNLQVQEISGKLSFANPFNFTRAFKRVSGLSPTEYRARCLQRADFVAE